ncbi:sensor domain-containing diguanylate cyclase [Pseudobutyrivibrio xylanivorans]|uniref:PAS domain S-box-containing protein/diguanylate cyclase (GGDEF) domain-containing protein n=1 Tax=Pseudobutyrivibrio xylanivorans DSM 14809 TaxID=1123012 RepID=A0A1M6HAU5_PSEXY|nr:sensor domain-containing diguanylate cyclase [Pseudobutyrivibrio xylanivorans]SHJ19351.1 PAS domain S-box-containing protein/diguanylate cyclase (GGDEF) domain-containing protein [Pseudobutyrivibrio xylanivorans DSM 14809]
MANKEKDILSNTDYSAQDILYMLRDLPDACCIFQVITDPFGTVKDMLFLFVNEKYANLVGKSTSELIGSTYYTTVSNRDEDWIRLSYQAAFMRQSVINSTYNTQFNKWFEFWAVPVYKKGFCAFIIHDVTAEKRKEEHRVITINSNNFILDCAKKLSANDFNKGIKIILKDLGTVLRADRTAVIECIHGEVGELYTWADKIGGTGLPSKNVFDQFDFFTMWKGQMRDDPLFICDDVSLVNTQNSEVYKSVLHGTITRYIVAALKNKEETIGFLLIENYSLDLDINVRAVVESISIFIAEELRNYKMTQELSYRSTHDELTGLGNRHSYVATLSMLDELDVSVGVCFVDINGLKQINDTNGHVEGDNVIRETANILAGVFKKKYCYRVGGDEFVVVIPQISQEHYEEQIEKLRKKAKNKAFAMGTVWSDNASDVEELINQADKLMYVDKAEYFLEHERRHP